MKTHGKLIIIDDEVDLGQMLKSLFEEKFSEVYCSDKPEEGLREALFDNSDLIISDIRMPKLSGDTLVKQIRSHGVLTPIIFLSGFITKDVYVLAIRLGVADIFEKPFNFNYMSEAIDRILALEKFKKNYYGHLAQSDYPKEKLEIEKRQLGNLHLAADYKKI